MFWHSSTTLAFLAAIVTVRGTSVVTQDWTLAAKTIAPDGNPRSAELVNGVYPGPLLTANKGDTIVVNVDNQLSDPTMRRSTSIHWHGIFHPRNAYDDGPSFVTQCPIAPNNSYPYTLILGEQAGTFWYHSHLSTQYVDGIRGPLVIYDPNDPQKHLYDVDDANTIITLSDWYHQSALASTEAWLSGTTGQPVANSGLINGKGRYRDGPLVERARINVQHGKRYRFRLISMSASASFDFSIPKHSMTIIEADGIAHQPYTVDSVTLVAGQRYSVIVTANQTIDNYWIGATPNFNGADVLAVLHYDGAPDTEPTTPQPTVPPAGTPFREFNLKPLDAVPAYGEPDRTFTFQYNSASSSGAVAANQWMINGIQYKSPSVPTLLNILANGYTNDSQFGPNENTFVLQRDQIIEVVFSGGPNHPFHLHGHAFQVIRSASGEVDMNNPPVRDVVASGTGANTVRIRFKTDNPGPWSIHCHIDWHLEAGLAAVFVEDPTGMQSGPKSIQPSAEWQKLCNIYDALDPSLQ